MKKLLTILAVIVGAALGIKAETLPYIKTNSGKKIDASQMMASGSSGTEFIIAFPASDVDMWDVGCQEIYITSALDIKVTWKNNAIADGGKIDVKAYTITSIARSPSDEIREFEKAVNKTFMLTSTNRFSVYVMNMKTSSSDGYMAIPTAVWGRRYIHLCYRDNAE